MNDAHLHLVVNHFQLLEPFFGLGILIGGSLFKTMRSKKYSYVLFIVAAVLHLLSMYTGEDAEEMVEDMPNIGKQIIHEHEELAENFLIALSLYLASLFSLLEKIIMLILSYITLIFFGNAVLGSFMGTSGGEIRHTEIREMHFLAVSIIRRQ
jgi:cobalamin synthase